MLAMQRGASAALAKGRVAISAPIQLPAGFAAAPVSLSFCSFFGIVWCSFTLGFATAIFFVYLVLYGPIALVHLD